MAVGAKKNSGSWMDTFCRSCHNRPVVAFMTPSDKTGSESFAVASEML